MSQGTGLIQTQEQIMAQKLTPQQILQVRLIEMPIANLEQCVKNEMDENLAIAEGRDKDEETTSTDPNDDIYNEEEGGQESETQIQLGEYGSEDDIPDYLRRQMETDFKEPQPIGDSTTFLDELLSQMVNYDLTEHQQVLITYLIGSLDDNGFLDQPLYRIADEMLFNHDIETDEEELEEVIAILQQFDPAGIGARNSQESLVLQIDRALNTEGITEDKRATLQLERRIVAEDYEDFKNRNYDKIAQNLEEDPAIIRYAINEIKKHLNPRPGIALCESPSDKVQTAIPDFIVETDGEGGISFQLNRGNVPLLHISEEYRNTLLAYQKKGDKIPRHEKEGMIFYKQRIDAAQGFIDAIRQRQHTLTVIMRTIIAFQKAFFLSQDEEELTTLIYKDVAKATNLDISTVSRVCKDKFALLDGKMYPLTFFFKHNRKNKDGKEVEADKVADAIQHLVDNENKKEPYTDDQLVNKLEEMGISIARRTANKYRIELAIPSAAKRKA